MKWEYKELRRAVWNKKMLLALVMSSASLYYGCYDCDSPSTGYIDLFLFSQGYSTTAILALIFPIIAVLPFAATYREERQSGYYFLICGKTGRLRYCCIKLLYVFLTGASAVGVPNLLFLFICLFLKQGMIGESSISIGFLWPLYCERPLLYGALIAVNSALCGGIFSLLGLGISAWFKNKYIAALLPFGGYIFSGMLLAYIAPWLNAICLFALNAYGAGAMLYLIYDLALLCGGILLFVTGAYYEDFKA